MGKQKLENFSSKKCSGKNNHTSKNIAVVAERFDSLNFVKHMSLGHIKQSNQSPGIEIKGYDHNKKQYLLNVHGGKYTQKVSLNVAQENEDYKKRIFACAPN